MSWKTKIIIPFLSAVGGIKLKAFSSHRKLLILAYHRIIPDHQHFLFDRGVISASPAIFEEQVKFLSEHFSFLSFQSLKKYLNNELKLPKPAVIITFDDGYLDNYIYAYPILKKYNACGTIFLAVNYINSNNVFWWDELAFCIHQTQQSKVDINVGNIEYTFSLADKEKAVEGILQLFKRVSDAERILFLAEVKERLKSNFSQYRFDRQILNWDEIRQMANDNMEFGSHTMTHPILSNVKAVEQLQYELQESKSVIEKQTQKNVCVFSYPVGRKDSINDQVISQVKEAGYDFATTYQHGINDLKKMDMYYLKRLDIDHYPVDKFKAKISFPEIFKQ